MGKKGTLPWLLIQRLSLSACSHAEARCHRGSSPRCSPHSLLPCRRCPLWAASRCLPSTWTPSPSPTTSCCATQVGGRSRELRAGRGGLSAAGARHAAAGTAVPVRGASCATGAMLTLTLSHNPTLQLHCHAPWPTCCASGSSSAACEAERIP